MKIIKKDVYICVQNMVFCGKNMALCGQNTVKFLVLSKYIPFGSIMVGYK